MSKHRKNPPTATDPTPPRTALIFVMVVLLILALATALA